MQGGCYLTRSEVILGIDAEILIKYRGERPTDAQLSRWSFDLCSAVGAKHFFIKDGMPPDEYRAASKAWHQAFNAHRLYAAWNAAPWGDEKTAMHKAIFADIGGAPEELRRAIELTNRRYPLDDDSGVPDDYRTPGLCWTQDGPPVYAKPGETLLEVSVWTRYYGEGYERGDILTLCAIAEWAEVNMQPCEVWYGGDSSGVCVARFDNARRSGLRAHLYGTAGRDYFKYDSDKARKHPKPCGLCIPDEPRFNQFGHGANYCAVSCSGCGKSFETRDGGATWGPHKD
jgi:hypothetical protein